MLINNEKEIVKGILNNGLDVLEFCLPNDQVLEKYLTRIDSERLNYPIPKINNSTINDWFIPDSYKEVDIEEYLIDQCPEENRTRLMQELELYRKHDMIMVLRAMKYIVDTLRTNNIVWGVGRGSSVASFVLYKLGVHRIDSMFYKLDVGEFLR